MPYFKNDEVNILLIHIPKTGGTSLEKYFSAKFNIPISCDLQGNKALFWYLDLGEKHRNKIDIRSSLQHLTYKEILKYNHYFKVDMNNLKIISIVRNPYTRLVSDLFWYDIIKMKSTKEEVFKKLETLLSDYKGAHDCHFYPQHIYLMDDNEKLCDNITLMRTETLNDDMKNAGFLDFNKHEHKSKGVKNIYDYLNMDSINLINDYYDKDFRLFNYKKLIE